MFMVLDAKKLKAELGLHYDPTSPLEVRCDNCGDMVSEEMDKCPSCSIPVVWKRSPTWKRLYGNPVSAINRLVLCPVDDAAKELFKQAGVSLFSTRADKTLWAEAIDKLGEAEVRRIARWCIKKHKKRGYGVVRHALNILRSKCNEEPDSEEGKWFESI